MIVLHVDAIIGSCLYIVRIINESAKILRERIKIIERRFLDVFCILLANHLEAKLGNNSPYKDADRVTLPA